MKKMNKILLLSALLALVISGCQSGANGELVGVDNRTTWFEPRPTGMAFIPQGAFQFGQSEEDVPFAMNAQPHTVSIDAFWMDITEISNNEYRQFVYWVRDSIAMRLCVKNGLTDFQIEAPAEFDPDFYDPGNPNEVHLDWSNRKLIWKGDNPEVAQATKDMYYSKQDALYGKKELNSHMLIYEYYYVDLYQAAKSNNKFVYDDLGGTGDLPQGHYEGTIISYDYDSYGEEEDFENRSALVQHQKVSIYPDTLVWISDYTYSFNDPITRKYFWHPAFDNYPVVGVSWHQANAFTSWRTNIMKNYNKSQNVPPFEDYRLPTEAEWEYAAKGDLQNAVYPWGGPYTRNYQGCLLANFKPMRGMYALDGANRTTIIASYQANGYGLYDMAGNVSEWTIGAFDDAASNFTHDLNPNYTYNPKGNDSDAKRRKVIKGGSWKDIGYYLQCGVKSYEYQDSSKSYIGFRNVRSYLGKDVQSWEGY